VTPGYGGDPGEALPGPVLGPRLCAGTATAHGSPTLKKHALTGQRPQET
jgi:hypothetical protein